MVLSRSRWIRVIEASRLPPFHLKGRRLWADEGGIFRNCSLDTDYIFTEVDCHVIRRRCLNVTLQFTVEK